MDIFVGLLAGFALLALMTAGLVVGVVEVTRGIDHRTCAEFGQASNREVTFVEFTYFTWDCLTPDSNGKMISIDRLRDFDN